MKMPGEIGAPFGAIVLWNPPNRGRKRLAHLVDEVNGGLDGVVVIDLEAAVARGFIDRGELVEAPRLRLEMLDVHRDRLTWDMQLGAPLRPRPVTLLGDARDTVFAQEAAGSSAGTERRHDTGGGRAAGAEPRTGVLAGHDARALRGVAGAETVSLGAREAGAS